MRAYKEAHPGCEVISLGIGDVTQPLAPAIIERLHSAVDEMADAKTFKGYAPDLGYEFLRTTIAENDYKARGVDIAADEILSVMVQRAILPIFRRFSAWIIKLQSAILYIRFM